ncbi:EF-hand domain-containing protein [Roseovarius aestuariivivens]|uniref:EF-hand domain-containing protein n=1 Tax=Roseovarius aestuariivivens TaxID=1888910 RepID=UPI001080AA8E|nr:EF-hand domain-containing protein [Roseovarius aestuariivivens]
MTKDLKATALTVLLFVPGLALAATPMDTDGDGLVSMKEFQSAMPDASPAVFDELDSNGDGLLSEEEVTAGQEAGILPA